ncbi:MAG: hypothetical protein Q9159_001944 [Coniocarpon cinnabarinum]
MVSPRTVFLALPISSYAMLSSARYSDAHQALITRAVPFAGVSGAADSAAADAAADSASVNAASNAASDPAIGSSSSGVRGSTPGTDSEPGRPNDATEPYEPGPEPIGAGTGEPSAGEIANSQSSTETNSQGADWVEMLSQAVDVVKEVVENVMSDDSSQTSLATLLPTNSAAVSSMIVATTTGTGIPFPSSLVPSGVSPSQSAWLSREYVAEVATAQAAASAATPTTRASATTSYVPPATTGGAVRLNVGSWVGMGLAVGAVGGFSL